jgi:Icc-related predicted phosphoesterase
MHRPFAFSVSLVFSQFENVTDVRYLNAASGGRTEVARLPILRTRVPPFGGDLDAIIACSDLQGIVRGANNVAELLGVRVAEVLEELAFEGVLPPCARTGVILAGDMYCVPAANERGGYGEVFDAWLAFNQRFAWVAGVAGNHDDMTGVAKLGRCHVLDGDVVTLDGIRIGGVGGIIGNPRKPCRRSERDQLALIDRVTDVDILVLHEGPHGDDSQRGNAVIREAIEEAEVPLTICGHCYWPNAIADYEHGQMMNVDGRVVVLDARG